MKDRIWFRSLKRPAIVMSIETSLFAEGTEFTPHFLAMLTDEDYMLAYSSLIRDGVQWKPFMDEFPQNPEDFIEFLTDEEISEFTTKDDNDE